MKCPTCDVKLIDGGRPGVASGYCPECQGEWFARGVVDFLLDRARLPGRRGHDAPDDRWAAAVAPVGGDRREGLWNWF